MCDAVVVDYLWWWAVYIPDWFVFSPSPSLLRSEAWSVKESALQSYILLLTLHLTLNLPLPILYFIQILFQNYLLFMYLFIYWLVIYLMILFIWFLDKRVNILSFASQEVKCTLFLIFLYSSASPVPHTKPHVWQLHFMSLIKLIVFSYNYISFSLLPRLQYSATICSNILGV